MKNLSKTKWTVNVSKADGELAVDTSDWPQAALEYVFQYGLDQSIGGDSHSQIGLTPGKANYVEGATKATILDAAQKKADSLARGEFRVGGGGKRRDELLVESIAIVANRTKVAVSKVSKAIKSWADMKTECESIAKAVGKSGKGNVILVNLKKAAQSNIDARSGDFI